MSIQIRAFCPDDYSAFRELRLDALKHQSEAFASSFAEDDALSAEQWMEKIAGPSATLFIAWDDGRPVGMCGIYFVPRVRLKHKAYLWGMYVDPSQRGKKVAQQLLEHCKQWAVNRNIRTVLLAVMENNAAAIRLYEHFGFVRYGLEPDSIKIDGTFYNDVLFALQV